MSSELGNRADVEIGPDEHKLYGPGDARLDEHARVAQLVAQQLDAAIARLVELGIPEYITVDKTVAQGEAAAGRKISDLSGDFPDIVADGSWQLDGIVAIADASASADLSVTIAGLLPGVSLELTVARKVTIGGQSTYMPVCKTIRAGERLGQFSGITATVSGGATGDKVYLGFVFRKVRDVRVQGLQ